eukprot:7633105-Pyramimonas_sp.AAC.1
MATLADIAKETALFLCDPGFQRARDEEKRLGPLISVVLNASLGGHLSPAHPGADSSGKPLSRPEVYEQRQERSEAAQTASLLPPQMNTGALAAITWAATRMR